MKSKSGIKKKIKITIIFLCVSYFLFVVISCVVPPLFQKDPSLPRVNALDNIPADYVQNSERVLSIDDCHNALVQRLKMIEQAQQELIISTFDFRTDTNGKIIIASLMRAANRGVKVKILVDGLNGALHLDNNYFKALLSLDNIQAKFYNPCGPFTLWKVNYRMHDKYMVADQNIYMIGGRNINDYFLGESKVQKIDRELLVYLPLPSENNSLMQITKYFNSVWELPVCKERTYSGSSSKVQNAAKELNEIYASTMQFYPEAFLPTDWEQETILAESIFLLANPIEAKNKAPELWNSLLGIMEGGKDIMIQTPYAIFNKGMYDDISALTQDRRVQILTNSVENSDNPFGAATYLNQKSKLFGTGAEIFEYSNSQSLHTKTLLIDKDIVVVGSFNMDVRSAYLSTETMLVVKSVQLNQQLREHTNSMVQYSNHVMPSGKETAGDHYQEKPLTFWRKLGYGVLSVLLIPFRHLL